MISGLPGAGKSTVARALAEALEVPLIDKDVVLEALFDSLGVGDGDWRARLSRAADEVLFAMARDMPCAILDNWWHHDRHPARLEALGRPLGLAGPLLVVDTSKSVDLDHRCRRVSAAIRLEPERPRRSSS